MSPAGAIRKEVPNDVFVNLFLKYCQVNTPIEVIGPVELNGETLPKPVTLQRVVFRNRVSMRGCVAHGSLTLVECRFEEGLDLSHSEIHDDLRIVGQWRGGASGRPDFSLIITFPQLPKATILLDHVHVRGSLLMKDVEALGAAPLNDGLQYLDPGAGSTPCLSLVEADIEGDCVFKGVSFKAAPRTGDNDQFFRAIDLSGLRTTNLRFQAADESSLQSLYNRQDSHALYNRQDSHAGSRWNDVAGDLKAEGVECALALQIASSQFRDVNFQMAKANNIRLYSSISDGISFQDSKCVNFSMNNIYCESDLNLGGISCDSILQVNGHGGEEFADRSRTPTSKSKLDNTYIRGKIDLWGCSAKTELGIYNAQVGERVWLASAQVGRLTIEGSPSNPVEGSPSRPVKLGALIVDGSRIQHARIHQVKVADRDERAEFSGRIMFRDCEIAGDASFFQVKRIDDNAEDGGRDRREERGWADESARTEVAGKLEVLRCRIAGDLDLTRVRVGGDNAPANDSRPESGAGDGRREQESAAIILDGTEVKGRIRFASPESVQLDERAEQEEKDEAKNRLGERSSPGAADDGSKPWAYDAAADRLSMDNVKAREVDLTGLTLRRPEGNRSDGDPRGHVSADDVDIHQEFRCYAEYDGPETSLSNLSQDFRDAGQFPGKSNPQGGSPTPPSSPQTRGSRTSPRKKHRRSAQIPGALRLRNAKIGTLIITADSFDDGDSHTADKDGIVLRNATIGCLEIPCREDKKGEKCNGFPASMDFTDAKISRWNFDNSPNSDKSPDHADGYEKAKPYLDVLDNDVNISRDLYRAVARELRNEGRRDAATYVHFAEHYRAFWAQRQVWRKGRGRLRRRWPWNTILEMLTCYVFEPINRKLLRYGADPLPLFGVIIFLAAVSFTLVALDPRNFEIAAGNRQLVASQGIRDKLPDFRNHSVARPTAAPDAPYVTHGERPCDDGRVLSPMPDRWGLADAAWITARYHIPIINIAATDDVVPTDDRGVIYAVRFVDDLIGRRDEKPRPAPKELWTQDADDYRSCAKPPQSGEAPTEWVSRRSDPITPEDWFQIMSILNWVMWPLLLTALVGRLLMKED